MATPLFLAISLLPNGQHPALPSFTNDQKKIIVPNQDTDNVSIVDTQSFAVTNVIPVYTGACPWQAAVTPDGTKALVTNSRFSSTPSQQNSDVSIIDTSTWQITGSIGVGVGPNGIVIDSAGAFAYVANQRSNNVSVIDLNLLQTVASIPVGNAPTAVALSSDGTQLLVLNFEDASLNFVNVTSRQITSTLIVGETGLNEPYPEWGTGDPVQIEILQNYAYITNWRSNSIVKVDVTQKQIISSQGTLNNPFGINLSSSLDLLVISSMTVSSYSAFKLSTMELIGTFPFDGQYSPPSGVLQNVTIWATDVPNDRIVALMPTGIDGLAALGPARSL